MPRDAEMAGVVHPQEGVMCGSELVLGFLELADSQQDGADDPSLAGIDFGPGAASRLDLTVGAGRKSPRR